MPTYSSTNSLGSDIDLTELDATVLAGLHCTPIIRPPLFKPTAVNAGTWGATYAADYIGMAYYDTNNAQNDAVEWDTFVGAGTYNAVMMGHADTNRGIVRVYVDAVKIAEFDFYSGSNTKNVIKIDSTTDGVVTTSGMAKIHLKCETKNASSSAYVVRIQDFAIYRVA